MLLLSAIPALLIMAFIFDFASGALQEQNMAGAGYEPLLVWLLPIFELILVLGGMGLLWLAVRFDARSKLVGYPALVVGLLIVLLPPLLFFFAPMNLYFLVQYVQPGTYMFTAGALLAGVGVFSLIPVKDKDPQTAL
jgi:hypothetical protein